MRWCLLSVLVGLGVAGCATPQGASPAPDFGGVIDDAALEDAATPPDLTDGAVPPDLVPVIDPSSCLFKVVINEVSTRGSASAFDELVELYNPCAEAVTLDGAQLWYRSATAVADTNIVAMLSGTIEPNGFFLVANDAYSGTVTPDIKPFANANLGLADAGGAVGLRDPTGKLIDSVGWGSANNVFVESAVASSPSSGQSIARQPNGTDTNDNQSDFRVGARTPRAAN